MKATTRKKAAPRKARSVKARSAKAGYKKKALFGDDDDDDDDDFVETSRSSSRKKTAQKVTWFSRGELCDAYQKQVPKQCRVGDVASLSKAELSSAIEKASSTK